MKKLRTNEAAWLEKSGRWSIKVQRDGERKQFTSSKPGRKGKLEAERKADEWLEKGLTGKDPRAGEAYKEFVARKRATSKTQSSDWSVKLDSLGRIHILPYIEHKRVSTITQLDWEDIMSRAAEQRNNGRPLSHKTLENIRSAITGFVTYCRKAGYNIRPVETLEVSADAPIGERQIASADDLKTLFSVDTIRHYNQDVKCWYINAWRLACVMGLRRGEIAGLRTEDYDGERLTIGRSINRLCEVTTGKNRTAHRSPALPPTAKQILADQAALLRAAGIISPWIFPGADGQQSDPNRIYKSWLVYRRQHGITSISIHEMRHTSVSYLQDEVPLNALKHMVGHTKNMDTTKIYGHEIDGEAEQTARTVEAVFSKLIK